MSSTGATNPEEQVKLAHRLFKEGQYVEAIATANAVISHAGVDDDNLQRAWCIRAFSKQADGKMEEAIEDHTRLLQQASLSDARKAQALVARGDAYRALEDHDKAWSDWTQVIDARRDAPTDQYRNALIRRAHLHLMCDPQSAIADCEVLLECLRDHRSGQAIYARLLKANAYCELERYADALEIYSCVLQSRNDLPEDLLCLALFLRASAYRSTGQARLAIDDHKELLSTPCIFSTSKTLECLVELAGLFHAINDKECFRTAINDIEDRLGSVDADTKAEYLQLSSAVSRKQGNSSKAIASLTEIIEDAADCSGDYLFKARAERGLLHLDADNPATAFDDFDQALAWFNGIRGEDYWITILNRGQASNLSGNLDDAISDYSTVVADCPEAYLGPRYDAIRNRGICYRRYGDMEAAMHDFEQLINLTGAKEEAETIEYHARGLIERGRTLGALGRASEEMQDYTRVITNPDCTPPHVIGTALFLRGLANLRSDRLEDATNDFTELVEGEYAQEESRVALSLHYRGFAFAQQGQKEAAERDFTQVAEGFPDLGAPAVAQGLLARGYLHSGEADFANSIADYSRVIELGSSAPIEILGQALFNRASDYAMQQGRLAHAIEDLDYIIEKLPGVSPAITARARVVRGIARQMSGDEGGLADCRQADSIFSLTRSQGHTSDLSLEKMSKRLQEPLPSSERIDLLLERARRSIYYGAWQEAVEDFNTVILEEANCTAEQLARAWELRMYWCMLSGDERGSSDAKRNMGSAREGLLGRTASESQVLDDEEELWGEVKWF